MLPSWQIREVIASCPIQAESSDLHVWQVGKGYACILSLFTAEDVSPEHFKEQLSILEELVHITIEVNGRSSVIK